ncbi:MAG: Ig-like domain-containing protein, partial [bacterium]
KMTLSAITTSGAWGPYTAKVNLAANNTSTIVDASANPADIAASDVSISGIAGPSLNSTPVVTPSNLTATVAWTTVTSTTSNQIKYGTTVSLGSTSTAGTPGESTTTHSINLSSLTASTLYYYQVCFTDVSEYCTTIDHFTTTATTDVAAPTISSQTPTDNSTSVAITASPTITFSEAMDAATINGGTVKLRKYSDDSDITATLLYNPSTFVVTIDPVASLDNNTQYYIYSTGVKDVAGNATSTDYSATAKASHEFTTVTESVSLAVTQIAATKTTMTADATYANGGSWTFNFTVPTSETNLQLKFTDWVSGSNTIAVASNMRIYSAQSSNAATSGAAITLTAASTYST